MSDSWPELVGKDARIAKSEIQRKNKNYQVTIHNRNDMVTADWIDNR
jgi:hypothetical protein